ncbi:MAG: DUF1638 domain-containing protein [Acidimicrobiales bacterium]
MSSSRIVPTSTIVSSSCCSSRPDEPAQLPPAQSEPAQLPAGQPEPAQARPPLAVVACGAIGAKVRAAVARSMAATGDIDVHSLPPLLHNRPQAIAGEVRRLVQQLQAAGRTVVVAYADCGTYGALDDVCADLGVKRLRGLHCYDVLAGPERIAALLEEEPGTYLLTDFLVRTFHRTVMSELGLDRHPELWADYFGNYRRVVWLAQQATEALEQEARSIATRFGLPLEIVHTGSGGLDAELHRLIQLAIA